MNAHLEVALDRKRSRAVRATAYNLYEIEEWYNAHVERNFPLALIPEDKRHHVYHLITERLRPLRTYPMLNAG
jgi:hypothetical protein